MSITTASGAAALAGSASTSAFGASRAAPSGASSTASPPHLPRMVRDVDGLLVPEAPKTLADAGLDEFVIPDLALKLTGTLPHITTTWAADQLRLPAPLIERIFWQMKEDQLVEILGQVDEFTYRYTITPRGREFARRSHEISGYVGPAPVSLEAYSAMLQWQTAQRTPATFERIRDTITNALVLPDKVVEVAALAASSARSLFVFGPAGNGKTSLGRLLHRVIGGELWIPHCVSIGGTIIRIFDRQLHETIDPDGDSPHPGGTGTRLDPTDRRWIRIRPPFIVAGGEMTMEELDLAYSPTRRFYEAPPHVKANGGTFLIDDFGRQRIEPHELLNRWIIPLESQFDHLTLATGQKIQIPFQLLLVVATNLDVSVVSDPAFLRRMGYRLHLNAPSLEDYRTIFQNYA